MIIWSPCQHSGLFIARKERIIYILKGGLWLICGVKKQPYRGYECLLEALALLVILEYYVTLPNALYSITAYGFISKGNFPFEQHS